MFKQEHEMGISVSDQEDSGFDSCNSLQPLLGDEHIGGTVPRLYPEMGASKWEKAHRNGVPSHL